MFSLYIHKRMSNIKVFENDLPDDLDLSNEKFIGLDNEALGLVLEEIRLHLCN